MSNDLRPGDKDRHPSPKGFPGPRENTFLTKGRRDDAMLTHELRRGTLYVYLSGDLDHSCAAGDSFSKSRA